MESEIWPNLLLRLQDRGQINVFLAQGRISKKTYHGWRKIPKTIALLLSSFRLGFVQSKRDEEYLQNLGLRPIYNTDNLKYLSPPLPVAPDQFKILQSQIGGRIFFTAASTHRGEEVKILTSYRALKQKIPDLLCIIIPRHPERGNEVAKLIEKQNLTLARRSQNQPIGKSTDIYLADSLGETGLFYKLSDIVVMGGSFVPIGGHNLFEAVQHHAICLYGPYIDNFTEMAQRLTSENTCLEVADTDALTQKILMLDAKSKTRATDAK